MRSVQRVYAWRFDITSHVVTACIRSRAVRIATVALLCVSDCPTPIEEAMSEQISEETNKPEEQPAASSEPVAEAAEPKPSADSEGEKPEEKPTDGGEGEATPQEEQRASEEEEDEEPEEPEDGVPIVLVTGASGFIATHLVKLLLEQGRYRVRGTVRSTKREDKVLIFRIP